MTVAIGVLSQSALTVGADSRYSTGVQVMDGEKIFPIPPRANYRVVVAGAGDVGFIKAASQKIENALPFRESTVDGLTAIIESANKSYYEQYMIPHGQDKMTYELLVAIGMKDGTMQLIKTTDNSIELISDYAPLGTGGFTSALYMGLWREDMTEFDAELMTAFVIAYAKEYDAYCGGDSHIYTMIGTDLFKLDSSYIHQSEAYFKEFNRRYLDILLPIELVDEDSMYYRDGMADILRWSVEQRKCLIRDNPKAHLRVP